MNWQEYHTFVKKSWKPKVYALKEWQARKFVLKIIEHNKLVNFKQVWTELGTAIRVGISNRSNLKDGKFVGAPELRSLNEKILREHENAKPKFKAYVESMQPKGEAVPYSGGLQFA